MVTNVEAFALGALVGLATLVAYKIAKRRWS